MWKRRTAKPIAQLVDRRREPTDAALLEALRLNHDHVRGLTRLDQELVYVPLAALGAVLFAVLPADKPPQFDVFGCWVGIVAGLSVMGIVLGGLARNHGRHKELLCYRRKLMAKLDLPCEKRHALICGRVIYAALFSIGWLVGGWMLLSVLTKT